VMRNPLRQIGLGACRKRHRAMKTGIIHHGIIKVKRLDGRSLEASR